MFSYKDLVRGVSSQKSKGFCSFDDGDTHIRSIDLVGVESAPSAIEVKDSQMKPETPNASHATPHFRREMQMETHQARQVDLLRLRRSQSAASKYLSHPWGTRGWSCTIHSIVLHGASNQDNLSLCRPLACFKYLSHPWGTRGWSCTIHSIVLHGASNQDKLSLCRPLGTDH